MVVASALRLLVFVFRLGQTHRIDVMRAILVPRGAENNRFHFNELREVAGAIIQTECNRLQLSRTEAHFSRWRRDGRARDARRSTFFRLLIQAVLGEFVRGIVRQRH